MYHNNHKEFIMRHGLLKQDAHGMLKFHCENIGSGIAEAMSHNQYEIAMMRHGF